LLSGSKWSSKFAVPFLTAYIRPRPLVLRVALHEQMTAAMPYNLRRKLFWSRLGEIYV
jgi:hypothetical protein